MGPLLRIQGLACDNLISFDPQNVFQFEQNIPPALENWNCDKSP